MTGKNAGKHEEKVFLVSVNVIVYVYAYSE